MLPAVCRLHILRKLYVPQLMRALWHASVHMPCFDHRLARYFHSHAEAICMLLKAVDAEQCIYALHPIRFICHYVSSLSGPQSSSRTRDIVGSVYMPVRTHANFRPYPIHGSFSPGGRGAVLRHTEKHAAHARLDARPHAATLNFILLLTTALSYTKFGMLATIYGRIS